MPGPPPDISNIKITLITFGDPVFRTHRVDRGPIFFGKARLNRFDAPDESYGVLYAGRDRFCAFIEALAKAAGTRIITTSELERRALSELKPSRPLRLIDLTTSGSLVRIGIDARLFSGDHVTAQLWSKALHEHPINADGLLYPSRLDPTRHALALFGDRAVKMVELSRHSWFAPGPPRLLLAEVMEHYRLELIETRYIVPRKPVAGVRQHGLFEE
jgi:hypothetical protein